MRRFIAMLLACWMAGALGQEPQIVDLPTRPGVTDRILVVAPPSPSAVVVLISGGAGNVDIAGNGTIRHEGNFLVRSRGLFAQQGFAVVVPDAPSDRRRPPYLGGDFRASAEHAADLGAIIGWARDRFGKPVWVVGTSRGTHSAATAAQRLHHAHAPDGIVLTSTILGRSRFGESTFAPLTELDLTGLKAAWIRERK